MPTIKTTAVAVVAIGSLLGAAGSAVADNAKPAPRSAPTGDGARSLCKRAPKIDKRLDRALHRLHGGAAKRGSITRLEKRVANAKAAGHNEIEKFLQGKLTFRRTLVTKLEQRQKGLDEVGKWCKANDNGKKNDSDKKDG